MSTLEDIIARGNRGVNHAANNRITCADGFSLSVIAGSGTYCTPRPGIQGMSLYGDDVDYSYPGPFVAVEVGFPSQRPEPWHCTEWNSGYDRHEDHPVCDGWAVYADGLGDPNDYATVYGYVPVAAVRALVALHGGEAEAAA